MSFAIFYRTSAMIESRRPACSLHFVNPHGLYDPSPNAYSHVAVATAPARIVFASGQGGEDRHGRLAPDFPGQVRRALENLEIALHAGGAELRDVAKLTVLIVDHSLERLQVFGAELRRMWGTLPPPACTLIPVPRLALDGMLFEIEATAVVSR